MNRQKKCFSFAMCALALAGMMTMTAFGAGKAELGNVSGGPGEIKTVEKEFPENLSAAAYADQLIVVVGTGGCSADISWYKKENTDWKLQWTEAGYVGRNGITSEKKEGDGATPAGTYAFSLAFGLKDNPGSILPYHQITEGDFWVDDPASSHYNQLANTGETEKDWNSAEDLIHTSPYYNYALNLDYNKDCVPGAGSAIFLHCLMGGSKTGSSGCICIPEERMKELLTSVTENTRIVIAPSAQELN